jgi:hypothetical protein
MTAEMEDVEFDGQKVSAEEPSAAWMQPGSIGKRVLSGVVTLDRPKTIEFWWFRPAE